MKQKLFTNVLLMAVIGVIFAANVYAMNCEIVKSSSNYTVAQYGNNDTTIVLYNQGTGATEIIAQAPAGAPDIMLLDASNSYVFYSTQNKQKEVEGWVYDIGKKTTKSVFWLGTPFCMFYGNYYSKIEGNKINVSLPTGQWGPYGPCGSNATAQELHIFNITSGSDVIVLP